MHSLNRNIKGFTLVELIIVVAIIALLAAGTFVAINPAKRIGEAQDAQRWADLVALAKAVDSYTADNGQLPADFSSSTIGLGDKIPLCDSQASLTCGDQTRSCLVVDDVDFLGTYLPQLPIDPKKTDKSDTGYYITRSEGNIIKIGSCDSYDADNEIKVSSKVQLPAFSKTCGGYYYAGYCWYMAPNVGWSCDDVCDDFSGVGSGGCVAEDWNDDSSCTVLSHLNICELCSESSNSISPQHVLTPMEECYYRASVSSQSCSTNSVGGRRLCACNN